MKICDGELVAVVKRSETKLDTILYLIGLGALITAAIIAWSLIFGEDGTKDDIIIENVLILSQL
jgi:hypothetical protein